MLEIIKQCYKQHFSTDGKLYVAPGRINMIGEHTDYNSGFVLPGAIDKLFYMMAAPNGTSTCQIYSISFDAMVSFEVNQSIPVEVPWAKYLFGTVKELLLLNPNIGGFDAVITSDIPIGAGISSSAAFTCATGTALNDMFHLGLSRMELAKAGQLCEHHYAGVRCGIMDQFVSLHGVEGQLIRLDCKTLDFKYVPFSPDGLNIVLLDTQVKHSLASSEYNVRRAECEEGVAHLKKSYPEVNSLRDVSLEMLEAHRSQLSPVVYNRCSFVVEENQRLLDACAALERGDYTSLGHRMYESHQGLRYKYEVSCTELNLLQETAQHFNGVLGSRMMGGGFGGCTINLVQEEVVEDFIAACSERFNKKFWKELRPIEVRIGQGARSLET